MAVILASRERATHHSSRQRRQDWAGRGQFITHLCVSDLDLAIVIVSLRSDRCYMRLPPRGVTSQSSLSPVTLNRERAILVLTLGASILEAAQHAKICGYTRDS